MDREDPMKPRVLVVEDDPVSRVFFLEVLSGLPAVVDAADGCGEAIAFARARPHALWLVDAHLPDGGAVDLLPRLRGVRGDADAIALAHTASRHPGVHATLLGAGFADVLAKPIGASHLLATVRRRLRMQVREPRATFAPVTAAPVTAAPVTTAPATTGMASDVSTGPWDDAAAMAAVGNASDVHALRALFARELPGVVAQVGAALRAGDAAAAREPLHRLASACAFTGAHRLGAAVRDLHREPFDMVAATAFREAAAQVLAPPVGL